MLVSYAATAGLIVLWAIPGAFLRCTLLSGAEPGDFSGIYRFRLERPHPLLYVFLAGLVVHAAESCCWNHFRTSHACALPAILLSDLCACRVSFPRCCSRC
jgi:hypothetical protein